MKRDDFYFMERALHQAENSRQKNEVPVGAVLVADGKVIGRGQNRMIRQNDPTAHAEIVALKQAGKKTGNYRLSGTDLYVTLEPCLMCYSAMVQARIRRLIYAAADPKTGIFSTGKYDLVKDIYNHNILVERGVLPEKATRMLKDFFHARRGAGAVERDGLENRYTG